MDVAGRGLRTGKFHPICLRLLLCMYGKSVGEAMVGGLDLGNSGASSVQKLAYKLRCRRRRDMFAVWARKRGDCDRRGLHYFWMRRQRGRELDCECWQDLREDGVDVNLHQWLGKCLLQLLGHLAWARWVGRWLGQDFVGSGVPRAGMDRLL